MMACMEHNCPHCKREWFDNRVYTACPHCGDYRVSNWFDEEPDYDDEPEELTDDE